MCVETKKNADSQWQEDLKNRITSVEQLKKIINMSHEEEANIYSVAQKFKIGITSFLLSLADADNPNCPIRKQIIPSVEELHSKPEESDDPLGDKRSSPVYGLTHRYPDRVLVYPTYECATYCRHCFRRKKVGHCDGRLSDEKTNNILNYLWDHKEINEVILTGGDPLTLDDNKLKNLFFNIRSLHHIRVLRIHTRIFVSLPSRITHNLVKILKSVQPLYIIVQVNHAKEISSLFKQAVEKISRAGIPILCQSVLLKNVNDDVQTLKSLFYSLVELGVKPYYLHHCDLARGISHFRTNIQKGVELLKQLRGSISGLCIPYYMVETTGGHGKVPIIYNYVKSRNETLTEIENYNGQIYKCPS